MSLADRMKRAISGELKSAIGETFSTGTLRDSLAAAVNAGTESFRQKAASRLAGTPEVDRAASRVGFERVKLFLVQWWPFLLLGAGGLWFLFRRKK